MANLLLLLRAFPYRKKIHGKGIMATVRKASRLLAH